jgi:peptidyl-prolyl cis-trans isomerase SurA
MAELRVQENVRLNAPGCARRGGTGVRGALWGALLLGALALGGCQRQRETDLAATVNGHPIRMAELDRYYRGNLGDGQHQPTPVQAGIAKLDILRQLIDDEILQQRAAKMNLVATDEEVDAKLAELKAPFTQEEFEQRLKAKAMTVDDLKRQIRRSLTTEKLLNKEINSKINITDADITNYYNANKAEFNLIEPEYHLAQIVVTGAPSAQAGNLQNSKAMNDSEARKKIEMLHSRLESGEDFGALAANFSEQPNTASSGGDMGFIPETQLRSDANVYASVMKLKPGQITDVLPIYDPGTKRVAGYAIYKLIAKEAAGQRTLSDPRVQQAIRQQLRDSRAQLLKNAYYEILRDQARVQNYFAEQVFKSGAQ